MRENDKIIVIHPLDTMKFDGYPSNRLAVEIGQSRTKWNTAQKPDISSYTAKNILFVWLIKTCILLNGQQGATH